jgi:hypothetical protein
MQVVGLAQIALDDTPIEGRPYLITEVVNKHIEQMPMLTRQLRVSRSLQPQLACTSQHSNEHPPRGRFILRTPLDLWQDFYGQVISSDDTAKRSEPQFTVSPV